MLVVETASTPPAAAAPSTPRSCYWTPTQHLLFGPLHLLSTCRAVHPQTPLPFTALYLELALPYTGAGGGVQVWLRPSTHCVADQQQQKRDRVRATRRSRAEWSSVHQLASFSLSLSYTGCCRRSCPPYEWKTESRACAPP